MPNVYLTDPLACLGKPDLYLKVNSQLQGYFDRVGQAMRPATTIRVFWSPATPVLTNQDLLVYFTSEEFSVVSRFSGSPFDPVGMSHWGYTNFKTVNGRVTMAASEVYAKILDADVLAKLAFHELMHNKLGLANTLHSKNGLAQATVGAGTTLTEQNVADMAAAMLNPVPQWLGGISLLLAARQRRDGGDSFWYQ